MQYAIEYLALDDAALLRQCEVHTYKSSGPGGQHRNKVSSAVRLVHGLTRISAHGDDSRSQHENKRLALKRLRMNIAMRLRAPVRATGPPAFVRECMFQPRGKMKNCKLQIANCKLNGNSKEPTLPLQSAICNPQSAISPKRLEIGTKDFRFWRIAAWLLDVLESCSGRVSDAAAVVGITTGNFSDLLTSDRHLLAAAQEIRKRHNLKPLL
jgi:hypothetical protein